MNQEKIGKFISECRKSKNLTQEQLSELLGISNRTISKWENGKGMPDYGVLPLLCDILGISINELLSGEHLKKDEYQKRLEENIILNMDLLKMKSKKIIKNIIYFIIMFILFVVIFIIFLIIYLEVGQSKKYLKNKEIIYDVCTINDEIMFNVRSIDTKSIIVENSPYNKTDHLKIYRTLSPKYMKDFDNENQILINKDTQYVYLNEKLIYEQGMRLEKCS